jgi:hypothetical protein
VTFLEDDSERPTLSIDFAADEPRNEVRRRTLLNIAVQSDRLCLHRGRRYESSHDVVEHKFQPEDRRSQIIGECFRLAIHPVPAADQALESQRELALRGCQNLLGSRLIKAHKALFG